MKPLPTINLFGCNHQLVKPPDVVLAGNEGDRFLRLEFADFTLRVAWHMPLPVTPSEIHDEVFLQYRLGRKLWPEMSGIEYAPPDFGQAGVITCCKVHWQNPDGPGGPLRNVVIHVDPKYLVPLGGVESGARATDAPPSRKLTMTEALLLKIGMGCIDLDKETRKPPSHWAVFIAAWKDGISAYEMCRRQKNKWCRRTVDERLRNVERNLLNGNKVSALRFDGSILKNVEKQLQAGRDCHAKNLHRPDLLENVRAQPRGF